MHGVEGSQSSCRELCGHCLPVLGTIACTSVGIIYAAGTNFKLPVTKDDHYGTYIYYCRIITVPT